MRTCTFGSCSSTTGHIKIKNDWFKTVVYLLGWSQYKSFTIYSNDANVIYHLIGSSFWMISFATPLLLISRYLTLILLSLRLEGHQDAILRCEYHQETISFIVSSFFSSKTNIGSFGLQLHLGHPSLVHSIRGACSEWRVVFSEQCAFKQELVLLHLCTIMENTDQPISDSEKVIKRGYIGCWITKQVKIDPTQAFSKAPTGQHA